MAIVALASIRDVVLAKGYDTSAFLLTRKIRCHGQVLAN